MKKILLLIACVLVPLVPLMAQRGPAGRHPGVAGPHPGPIHPGPGPGRPVPVPVPVPAPVPPPPGYYDRGGSDGVRLAADIVGLVGASVGTARALSQPQTVVVQQPAQPQTVVVQQPVQQQPVVQQQVVR